jgi:hypothetical protein
MRIETFVLPGVAVLFSCAAVHAATPPLPAVVAKALKETAAICTEVGGKPNTSQAIKRADLNGDGIEDYVLDVGSVGCEGAASVYGDREKGVIVYVGDGKGGAKEAFNGMSYGATLEGSGAAAKLWLTVSGGSCGKPPAKDFASENFCDRAIVWNAKTQKFDFAPVSTVKMIQ